MRLSSKTIVPALEPQDLEEACGQSNQPKQLEECLLLPDVRENPDIERNIQAFLEFDARHEGAAATAWPRLLEGAFSEFQGKPLQTMLLLLVARTWRNRCATEPLAERQCIEFFAGKALLTYARLERGL